MTVEIRPGLVHDCSRKSWHASPNRRLGDQGDRAAYFGGVYSQLLALRTETRGTWGRIDKHRLLPSRIPDFSVFSAEQIREIEAVFESVRTEEFPALIAQLRDGCAGRDKIDAYFL